MIFQKKITGKVGGKGVELCFEKLWENREGASSELRCPHAPSHSPCWARKKAGLCRGMLKGIPEILSPELLKVLCEMGHSDRLVIADGNFPVESMGKNAITIRCDGHGVPEILEAILKLFPLDTYVEHPVNLMEVMPGDNVETPIWDTYKEIVSKYDERGAACV